MNKFKAKKTSYNGITYDSKKEKKRALELELMQKNGKISELKRQVKFILQDSFKLIDKSKKSGFKTILAIRYIADFTYFDCVKNCFVIEDVKGYRTRDFNIKWKMLEYLHKEQINKKEIELRVV